MIKTFYFRLRNSFGFTSYLKSQKNDLTIFFFYLCGRIFSNRFAQFVERSFQHESTGINFLRFQRQERVRSNSKTWTYTHVKHRKSFCKQFTFVVILSSSYTCIVLPPSRWTWHFFFFYLLYQTLAVTPFPVCYAEARRENSFDFTITCI